MLTSHIVAAAIMTPLTGWLSDRYGLREVFIFSVSGFTGSENAFIDPRIFRDANFVMSLVMIFMVGMILLAGLALLPPMLQGVMGYPVVETGLVLAPRGVGTMISMLVVGRLVGRIDARLLILAGLGLTALSLWQMTRFSIAMDSRPLLVSGITQGMGLGLVFVPLTTIAFATLDTKYRADAAALFSLVRNIGSSVGISIVSMKLAFMRNPRRGQGPAEAPVME